MDQAKKRQIKKYASWIALVALVGLLTAMPMLAHSEPVVDGPKATILNGTVENGTINTVLKGGGVIAASDRTRINLPSGVKIKEFLVHNGDTVPEGTPLAVVDRVSVMSAITSVQETMDHLLEQMNELEDEEGPDEVRALAGGRVKQVFASEGERVQDVMLRDGALAVLSLDGLMAVRLEVRSTLTTGESVSVLLSDGTEISGRVESNLNGIVTVTVEDQNYSVGENVTVFDRDGNMLGAGMLYVHNAWHAITYTGVVERVRVEPEESVDEEELLFSLTDTSYAASRETLAAQHREYEDLMFRLFQMYQSETIDAPCDGMITGIDEDSIHLLRNENEDLTLDLLINAPNGDDQSFYLNFAAMVTGVDSGNWNLAMNLTPLSIPDYRDLSGISLDPKDMTQPVLFIPTIPVYQMREGQWEQIEPATVATGDFLLVAMDTNGKFVWIIRITEENMVPQEPEDTQPTVPPTEPALPDVPTDPIIPPVTEPPVITPPVTEPTAPNDPGEPTLPTGPSDPSMPTEPSTDPTTPSIPGFPSNPSIPGFQYPDFTLPGGYSDYFGSYGSYGSMGGTTSQEPEFQLHDLEGSTLMTLTGQETVTLRITLDEQDISRIHLGQDAIVLIEAIPDREFQATVTEIGSKGTNNGGSSKFTAELTFEKTAEMLPGMSATATISLSVTEEYPVIPLAALVEKGANTVIYTGYDAENEILTNPVEITVGASDGELVQILSGMKAGDSYWYAYYDTLKLSNEVTTQRSPFG